MKILRRHIARSLWRSTLFCMLLLLVLWLIVEFIELIENGDLGLDQAVFLTLLSIPRIVYELFPMAALLGTVTGLALLAKDSELIVMQASGVSRPQVVSASLRLVFAFCLLAVLIGEFVAPVTEHWTQRMQQDNLKKVVQPQRGSGLWLRDDNSFVHIGEVWPDLSLREIQIFDFTQDRHLHSMLFARKGVYQGTHWNLRDVRQTRIHPQGQAQASVTQRGVWQTTITPDTLTAFLILPEQLSFLQLRRYIAHLAANRQQTQAFELASWSRLVRPFSAAVLVMLALPFAFVHSRSQRVKRHLLAGVMLGLGFYAVNQGFCYAALAHGLSPWVGAALPTAALWLLAMVMWRWTAKMNSS